MVERARIHNVEDGWKPRESPTPKDVGAYPNTGIMLMRDTYMTGIRDDCIEDDEFMPGDIENSLFDGVWTFLSEQNQTRNDWLQAHGFAPRPLDDWNPMDDPVVAPTAR